MTISRRLVDRRISGTRIAKMLAALSVVGLCLAATGATAAEEKTAIFAGGSSLPLGILALSPKLSDDVILAGFVEKDGSGNLYAAWLPK